MENKINYESLGSVDSPSDPRDYRISDIASLNGDYQVPPNYTVSDYAPDNTKQLVNSCVAHCLTKMKRYFTKKSYSIGFLYGYRKNNQHQKTGLIPREACANLCEIGDCLKSDFDCDIEYPSILKTLEEHNINDLINKANNEKSLSYIRLEASEIKEYISKYDMPIMVIYKVYDNFYESKTNGGYIPTFGKGSYKGNHAMVCFEYRQDLLTNDNSWGNTGNHGLYYIDINSPLIKEAWAIVDTKIEKPKSGWEKYQTPAGMKWKYKKDNGTYACNEWLQIGQDWFKFNEYSIALCNEWFKDTDGKWYFLDENCYMTTGWLLWKGNYYYLYPQVGMPKGSMATNTVVDKKYYVNDNGCWDWITR